MNKIFKDILHKEDIQMDIKYMKSCSTLVIVKNI